MQLSNDTKDVLKNFSTINQNLLVKSGNVINTMSAMKNIVAKATIPDSFSNACIIPSSPPANIRPPVAVMAADSPGQQT